MQIKTINKVITKKLNEWLSTLPDEKLRKDVRDNIVVSGGCIASLLQGQPVNDYDIYLKDMDVLIRLATFYCPSVFDGRKKDKYINDRVSAYHHLPDGGEDLSSTMIRLKTLHPDQVKLDVASHGKKVDPIIDVVTGLPFKYQVAFLSQNAISLTDDIQIVTRFSGTTEEIHKNFDFIHATNYFTFKNGLVTNIPALESILTKQLKYQGSLYPLTSIIRMKKFLNRGWNINAGEILKIMFQIAALDLNNIEVLEEQLIGVDVAYFSTLIEIIRGEVKKDPNFVLTSAHLNELIEDVFNRHDDNEQIEKP